MFKALRSRLRTSLLFVSCSAAAAQSKCKMNPQTTAPATSLRHYLLSSLAKEEDTKNLSAALKRLLECLSTV